MVIIGSYTHQHGVPNFGEVISEHIAQEEGRWGSVPPEVMRMPPCGCGISPDAWSHQLVGEGEFKMGNNIHKARKAPDSFKELKKCQCRVNREQEGRR